MTPPSRCLQSPLLLPRTCPTLISCVRSVKEVLARFGWQWTAPTGQPRAVKLIPRHRVGSPDPAGREIASLVRLEANQRCRHPNLLTIHHVGETADYLFYVMELADDSLVCWKRFCGRSENAVG